MGLVRAALRRVFWGAGRIRLFLDFWLLRLLLALGVFKAYQPVPDAGIRIAPHREKGVLDRWRAIEAALPDGPHSLLDIGCNVGFYVVEAAKRGHFAAGLDQPTFANALHTIARHLRLDNVLTIGLRVSPDNVKSLPSFDCIIMLQVFHHLCRAYGQEQGLHMLTTIYGKANRCLLFETESPNHTSEKFKASLPDMGDDSEQWVRSFFEQLGCQQTRVIYQDTARQRSLILIEK